MKLFVAFHNEAERAEYIKNQKHSALADKNGEAEDAAAAADFDELEADCPVDGKFESRVLEFVYTPIGTFFFYFTSIHFFLVFFSIHIA